MALPNVVQFDDGRLLTRNLAPGVRVYDEELHTVGGEEHRTWNPSKSKLGAYLVKGGRQLSLTERSTVVYLGAANGTTPSHVSDIVRDGVMVAVEFSPRSFRDLLHVAQTRENVMPVLADAWRPELYERFVGKVDLLFQDIAQRQQAAIFAKNVLRFKPTQAVIAVKARSVDVAGNPRDIYRQVGEEVVALTGYDLVDSVELGPFEKDHAALVFRPGTGRPRPERRDVRAETRGGAPPERRERGPPQGERPQQRFERRGPPPGGPGKGGFQPRRDRQEGGDRGGGGERGGFEKRRKWR